jgi:hypothetical protein
MKLENCIEPKYSPNRGSNNGYFYTSYYTGGNKTFYTKSELEDHKNKINIIFKNSGNGKIGKVLYVGKGSNVPRHKVKVFIEENKIKKTSIIENSDTIFFDKKVINDVYVWMDRCKEVKVAIVPFTNNLLNIIKKSNNLTSQTHYIQQYIKSFDKKASLVIYHNEYSNYPQEFKQELGNLDWKDLYEQDTYRTKNIEDVFDTLLYYFKNPHGNIIWDDTILETLNSDGIDLDEDYISTLDSMFASKESDNIRLAIEMMSNVNLNKFGLTIALLLNKHKDVMNWGTGNTSSQAYKTLDRYFKNKGINWKYDFRTFSAGLYKNYSHNEEAKKIIEHFVLGNVNNYLNEIGYRIAGGYLQIDSFTISLHSKK